MAGRQAKGRLEIWSGERRDEEGAPLFRSLRRSAERATGERRSVPGHRQCAPRFGALTTRISDPARMNKTPNTLRNVAEPNGSPGSLHPVVSAHIVALSGGKDSTAMAL